MLVVDIFRLATRMFRTNRSRTVLTILGISVGIGAILFLVSLGYGLQILILNRITNSDALLSLDVSTGDVTNLKMDNNSIDDIKKVPGVEKISPLMSMPAQLVIEDISSELTSNFVDSTYFKLDGTIVKKGEFYSDDPKDNDKIIISSSALRLYNISEQDAFNKKLEFSFYPPREETSANANVVQDFVKIERAFKVIGIIEDEESNFVYIPFGVGNELGASSYSKVKVKVDSEDNLDTVRNMVMDKGYIVSALSDIIDQANQIFKIVQIVLASFGIVALIVSAIGMFNTMTIALLERTQEIGIMKALGATSLDIWNMFLAESVIIGFFGGLGGIAIGILTGELFNYLINFLAKTLGGAQIDIFYSPLWFITLIIAFSTMVGFMTGVYPARRAAKINCLEALRYK